MSGPRLSIIPARAATDPALKPRDLQVLCVLGRHTNDAGWCRRSQVKMAEEMGCGRATVFDAVERLIAAGYLERHVHAETNGRDSPHSFRVILDPVHPAIETVAEAEPGLDFGQTPAGIPAPPAGPRPAPPAGSGPAPKNDPFRTTPSERIERDAREGDGKEGQPQTAETVAEDRRAVERAFEKAWQAWPTSVSDSRPHAWKHWLTLGPDERDRATAEIGRYGEAVRKIGRKVLCSFGVYLAERRWRELPEPEQAGGQPETARAAPFGKAGNAYRLAKLLAGPEPSARIPPLTVFMQRLIADGKLDQAREERGQVARYGYPTVNALHEVWAQARSVAVPAAFEALGQGFEQVRVGGPLWEAWKAEHARRGWPWLPDPGRCEWAYFPPGGPDGLDDFEAALRRANGDEGDDGGARDAAE
jgi:hypothetical protein